ncbi:Ribonuclease H protein [Theobroma cacao]|uniref:Ribonuclease H protein n=1 Tax=Theobroma cacao TaxID=3641 RepID=A0A061E8U1_THECC|nr:Ribonuclease H protein [Theobroma cacao]
MFVLMVSLELFYLDSLAGIFWKWRNVKIFEGKLVPMNRKLSMIKGLAAASYHAVTIPCTRSSPNGYKREMLVGWQNPPQGWVAVNSDGALRRSTNLATAGGVLCDYNGFWLAQLSLYGNDPKTLNGLRGPAPGLSRQPIRQSKSNLNPSPNINSLKNPNFSSVIHYIFGLNLLVFQYASLRRCEWYQGFFFF